MTTAAVMTAEDRAWESLIAEQGQEVQPEHHLKPGDILSGQGDGLAPMKVGSLRYKGYVEVWDTETGDKSLQPWWLLWQTIRILTESGKPKYTRSNPHIDPDYGEDLFCPLNPNAPEGQRFVGRGFRPCRKRHIPHLDALEMHVHNKHNRAHQAIERIRQEQIRSEDRQLQMDAIEAQKAAMLTMSQAFASTVSGGTAPAQRRAPKAAAEVTVGCPDCGELFTSTRKIAANNKMQAHRKRHA